jgi:hypothetical protein
VSISNTVFDGCSSIDRGVVIFADITGIAAICSCDCISCSSPNTGSAIYFRRGGLQIAACSILNCNSVADMSSFYGMCSWNNGEAPDCSSTGGNCTHNTWNMESYSSAKQTVICGMNLTANTVMYHSAAMRFDLVELFF